jgi:hypothetical protein
MHMHCRYRVAPVQQILICHGSLHTNRQVADCHDPLDNCKDAWRGKLGEAEQDLRYIHLRTASNPKQD